MNNASASLSPPILAPAKGVTPSTAARTKLLLEGPILPTLLRLAAPNVLNLLAFAGVIMFDGFFSRPPRNQCARRRLAGVSLGDARAADDQQRHGHRRLVRGRTRARRRAPRPCRRSRLPRVSPGARDRRDLLHRAAAGRSLHILVDG